MGSQACTETGDITGNNNNNNNNKWYNSFPAQASVLATEFGPPGGQKAGIAQ